jgi:hypothetical protein
VLDLLSIAMKGAAIILTTLSKGTPIYAIPVMN